MNEPIPDDLDPMDAILLCGEATTAHEAEELSITRMLPYFLELVASPMSNEELAELPLSKLMLRHGCRPREDSL